MFNKAILKNFVIKQFEKQAAEQAKQQAMQQQQMPPQDMMPPQQQQMPMAQDGYQMPFDPGMTIPQYGGSKKYGDQNWFDADQDSNAMNYTSGNPYKPIKIGDPTKRGFVNSAIMAIKQNKENRQLDNNPYERIPLGAFKMKGQDRFSFQDGGPNPPAVDPEVTETPEGIYYTPARGVGSTINGQQYWYPDPVNISYEEDDSYESIFNPRIAEKRAANDAARRAYNDAVRKREKEIAEIEKARELYNEVWYVEYPDTTFKSDAERIKWQETNPKWQEATAILNKYPKASVGTNSLAINKAGYDYRPYFDPTADLSNLYPEEVDPLSLPYNIQYNLSDLPEDVDEGQFRQWINTYYPDYAKEHGIDPTVPRNAMNDIIKSAWYELGNEYIPFEPLPPKPLSLLEPERDMDIIRPEVESGPRVVRIDQAGYIPGSYNEMQTPQGPLRQQRWGKQPGYYNIDTGAWMGEDYVPPMDYSNIDPRMITNFFSRRSSNEISKKDGGSVRRLKLPQAQDGGMRGMIKNQGVSRMKDQGISRLKEQGISTMKEQGISGEDAAGVISKDLYNWGPTDPAEREKLHEKIRKGEVQDVILTLKDDKALIDGIANWSSVTGTDTINPAFNDQIKNRLYSGKWGYNPKTGYLVNLAKAKADKTTSLPESERKYLKDRETFWNDEMADFEKDRVPVKIADTEAWVPDFDFETYDGTMNSLDVMRKNQASGKYGQTVYMTPQEKATYEKKMLLNNWEHTVNHPLWTLPGQIYLGAFAGPASLTNTSRSTKSLLHAGKNINNKYLRSSALLDKGVRAMTQNSPKLQNTLLNASKYGTVENILAAKNVPMAGYYGYQTAVDPSWTNAGLAAYGALGASWPFMMNKMYP